jgi:hypothetical protein
MNLVNERSDKDFIILAAKALVNLSMNEKSRDIITKIGGIESSVQLMMFKDDDLKLLGAKWIMNLAISGRNRKLMSDKGIIAFLQKVNGSTSSVSVQSQITLAIENCSFPYEVKYEDLNFGLEEKLTENVAIDDDEDEETETDAFTRLRVEETEKEQRRQEIEDERRKISEERQVLESVKEKVQDGTKDILQRQEETQTMKAEEDKENLQRQEILLKQRELEIKRLDEEEAALRFQKEKEKVEKTTMTQKQKEIEEEEKKIIKRCNIVHEIVAVEKNYVDGLKIVVQKYYQPLQHSTKTQRPIIPAEKIKVIFSIIEIIHNYHALMLETLSSRVKRWLADQKISPLIISDIFIRMSKHLGCYSQYINNFDLAVTTLNESKKNFPIFAQFCKRVEQSPECNFQELEVGTFCFSFSNSSI